MNTKKTVLKRKNKYPIIIVEGGNVQDVFGCNQYILIDYDNIKEESVDELTERIQFYNNCVDELGECEESKILLEAISRIKEIRQCLTDENS